MRLKAWIYRLLHRKPQHGGLVEVALPEIEPVPPMEPLGKLTPRQAGSHLRPWEWRPIVTDWNKWHREVK